MDTVKKQRASHLSEASYREGAFVSLVIQKVVEKKGVILRKALFFILGLSFYLVSSFL